MYVKGWCYYLQDPLSNFVTWLNFLLNITSTLQILQQIPDKADYPPGVVLPELGSAWLSHASWAENSQAEWFSPLDCPQQLDPAYELAPLWYSWLSHGLYLILEVTTQTER